MIDQKNQNTMVVTGTPVLATGALSLDTNQALTFNGSTNSYAAADSTSLSITSSLSLELFVRFTALPGSTKNILSKASSYAVQLNSAGKLLFRLDNGASNVTVTSSATLATNTWYHVVCVYNDNYAGTQTFGETADGAGVMQLLTSSEQLVVNKFTLQELGILDSISARVEYFDETYDIQTKAVVYSDDGADPDDLVTTSGIVTVTSGTVDWRNLSTVTWPLIPVLAPAGDYNIGLITSFGGGPQLRISLDTSGGDLSRRTASDINSPPDPFGTPATANDDVMTVWCDYTAVGRTGQEGTAAIYINGQFDNSSAYTADIADNANSLIIATDFAGSVDEVSVWNRVLTPLEIATHYLAK